MSLSRSEGEAELNGSDLEGESLVVPEAGSSVVSPGALSLATSAR